MQYAVARSRLAQDERTTQVAEALQNLQQAVIQGYDAVFLTDAAGNLTRVNPAFEELTGYSSLEIVGKDLSLITEGGAQSEDYQQLWRPIFESKQFKGIFKLKTKSGESCQIELTISPLWGRRAGIMSLVGTARRATNVPSEKADTQNVNSEISRLVHDIKNMLLVVIAHSDLAGRALSADHPSRGHFESVKNAAQSVAALIHDYMGRSAGAKS